MKKLRVVLLFELESNPPKDQQYDELFKKEDVYFKTEVEITAALKTLGHEVIPFGIYNDIEELVQFIKLQKPDIVFNLTEHFNKIHSYDRNIAGLLELLGVSYTGCGPVSLANCRNKAIVKKLLSFHRIKNPAFATYPRGERVSFKKDLHFPVIIKPLTLDSSYGISKASLVENEKDFVERIAFIHEHFGQDALAENFVDGRELFVSLLGEKKLKIFPIRETIYPSNGDDPHAFLTFRAKWDEAYQSKKGIEFVFAKNLDPKTAARIQDTCKRIFRLLQLRGYARIDLRLTPENEIFIIEVNPNPALGKEDEFAQSLMKGGLSYEELIQKILSLGLQELRG